MVDAPKNIIQNSFHQPLPAVDAYPTKNAIKKRPLMLTSYLGAYPHPALPQAPISREKNIVPKEVN
jgi:hypothetical protein